VLSLNLDRDLIVADFSRSRPEALLIIVVRRHVISASWVVGITARNYSSKAVLLSVKNANPIICII